MSYPRLAASILVLLTASAGRADEATVSMTLQECLEKALDNNQDIALARKDRLAAAAVTDAARGIFDPLLNAALSTSRSESPTTSSLAGADVLVNESLPASVSVSELLPWGGTASLSLGASRSESNSAFSSLNPYYQSSLSLEVRHPLLRGFGKEETYYQIEVSRIGQEQSDESFELAVMQRLQDVENTYWDIVFAKSDLDVKRQSLKVAEDLLAQNKIRVEVGTLAPIELVQAEAGVAIRKGAIIASEARLKDTEEKLKSLMGIPPDDGLWDRTLDPSTELSAPAVDVDLDGARRAAGDRRMEIRLAQKDLDQRHLATEHQRNLVRPGLDATASYTTAGIGGTTIFRDPEGNVIGRDSGGLGDALDQVTGIDFPAWTVGLSFSWPVLNRSAKGNLASARIGEEKAAIQLEKTRRDIDVELRTAYRAVRTAEKSVEAARATERAQAKKLEAEQKKFENGLSTSFQVLEFDQDLAQARSDLLNAEIGQRKAIINLERAMGTLLDSKGIHVRD